MTTTTTLQHSDLPTFDSKFDLVTMLQPWDDTLQPFHFSAKLNSCLCSKSPKLWIFVFPLAFLYRKFCQAYQRNLHSSMTILLISDYWIFLKDIMKKSCSLLALLAMTIVFAILMLSPTIALYGGKLNRTTLFLVTKQQQ